MDRLTFKGKKRLLITLTAFMCSLAALSVRVGYIMLTKDEEYQNKAYEQQTRDRLITPKRGSILDRNGVGMAVTESVSSVSVIHAQIKDKEATATALSEILELDYDDVLEDIEERVALKRIKTKVDNETADVYKRQAIYGGIIAAVIFGIFYVKKRKLNFWDMADIMIPSVPLGQAIGCLLYTSRCV